jgi:hypothetical protein
MTIEITDESFSDAMHAEVAERGRDYIYPQDHRLGPDQGGTCRYVWEDKGDCIIGATLIRLGVEPRDLLALEGESGYAVVEALTTGWTTRLLVAATEAQGVQDKAPEFMGEKRDTSWGRAADEFDYWLTVEETPVTSLREGTAATTD